MHQPTANHVPPTLEEVLPLVQVPTATIIVADAADPWVVLIAESSKHPFPVLPGGKIEAGDLQTTSMRDAARACAIRELGEEVGIAASSLQFIGEFQGGTQDKRIVHRSTLVGTLVESLLPPAEGRSLIHALYGVPDFLFVATVERTAPRASLELHTLSWCDLRSPVQPRVSAGHDAHLRLYREWLRERRNGVYP
jgi:8-oxo-dGTP pyrophosphatase MutT (NUDIX family)